MCQLMFLFWGTEYDMILSDLTSWTESWSSPEHRVCVWECRAPGLPAPFFSSPLPGSTQRPTISHMANAWVVTSQYYAVLLDTQTPELEKLYPGVGPLIIIVPHDKPGPCPSSPHPQLRLLIYYESEKDDREGGN